MSSHWWASSGYGMFLDIDEANAMAKKYFEEDENDESPAGCEEADWFDLQEYISDYADVIDREDRFDGTAVRYLSDGTDEELVQGVMIYANRGGTIFLDDADEKHCFKNLQDMVNYFRKEYGKYLPEDFDYEAHMVEFWGAAFS
jgi:hypothetical protein